MLAGRLFLKYAGQGLTLQRLLQDLLNQDMH